MPIIIVANGSKQKSSTYCVFGIVDSFCVFTYLFFFSSETESLSM